MGDYGDYYEISHRYTKQGGLEIYIKFRVRKSKDLMTRGGDFYAVFDPKTNRWSESEFDALRLMDEALDTYKEEHPELVMANVLHLTDADTKMIDKWKHYLSVIPDNYHQLDETLIFSDHQLTREDYATKQLPYPLKEGPHDAWDEIVSTLYKPEEKQKIEWIIGAIVSGDSKTIQKCGVFYGSPKTGKSTILNIICLLVDGYWKPVDMKSLGAASSEFSLEQFRSGPLVGVQHDGDLSRLEDNTRLNSLISHETMLVNQKFKSSYAQKFNTFLLLGTNKPVRITDAKSGLLRRIIDIEPYNTPNRIPRARYDELMAKVQFELGGIAYHCLQIYREDPKAYENYVPTRMLGASNDFYNFVIESYDIFKRQDGTSLAQAWELYRTFCSKANVPYPMTRIKFKEELKNYFNSFSERVYQDGERLWNQYVGFKTDKFDIPKETKDATVEPEQPVNKTWIVLKEQPSILDRECANCKAQYASQKETPIMAWDNVQTKLSDLDTHRLHYLMPSIRLIVIDFDIRDDKGNKSLLLNMEAASKWPPTYAEVSKSGSGLHLHYWYDGTDADDIMRIYEPGIEIKVFTGKSSLRRMLTLCNDIPIANLSSGLPKKEGGKVLSKHSIKSEKSMRQLVERNLRKEIHGYTKPSIDFIFSILNEAYENGVKYDLRDMRPAVMAFAAESHNNAAYCLQKVAEMQFSSAEASQNVPFSNEAPIVIFDLEVFPNLVVLCWKTLDAPVNRWINPTQHQIEQFCDGRYRLVGFNNLKYDNHILYALLMGYDIHAVYNLSKRLIEKSKNAEFYESKNLSYTDIFDFSSEKKSLKKFEIEYGVHHQELGLDWDSEVPEELWDKVAEYCENDVIATQVVWEHRQGDFLAREILADLTGMTVNDTTNTLTGRLIFGDDKSPQVEFNYVHLGGSENSTVYGIHQVQSLATGKCYDVDPEYTCIDESTNQMIFPGYTFEWKYLKDDENGQKVFQPVSSYRGVEVGEGGYVFGKEGMYGRTTTKDVTSMHPHSIIAMNMFGSRYTKIFAELVHARVAIKRGMKSGDFSAVQELFGGKLMKYLTDVKQAKMLVTALKIAINSVYGLTAARFPNLFKDPRNEDNIVAKRGALFMVNLYHEVVRRGGNVVHIKTDSIKVENITPELEDFISAYGNLYGYSFETEHVFEKLCLVNKAVYIGKCAIDDPESPGVWEATGKQFAVPYVYKTLFSKEPIELADKTEIFNVQTALYLDLNEGYPDSTQMEKELAKLRKETPPNVDRITVLEAEIAKCHNYQFVGKTGAFCPIKPGRGGGYLMRRNDNTGGYGYATGAKGYRWLEAEVVSTLSREDDVDDGYYKKFVDDAIKTISKLGDVEVFCNG